VDLPDDQRYRLHEWSFSIRDAVIDVVDTEMGRDLEGALRSNGASLVINGGFFGTDLQAEGLVVAKGRRISPFLPRIGGGVLWTHTGRGRLSVATRKAGRGADFAIQCRPRLVVKGRPVVRRESGRRADRTALCLDDRGRTLRVFIARTQDRFGSSGPTLYTFARELVAQGCEDALNLDGGPSTGAAWQQDEGVRVLRPRGPIRHAVTFRIIGL